MNISKLTNWTKVVLILLLVCVAICSLMTAARLQGSTLQSSAANITNSYTVNYPNVTISRVDNYTCSATLRYTNNNNYPVDIDYVGVNTSYQRALVDQFRLQYSWFYSINGGSTLNDTVWTDCADISYTSIHLEAGDEVLIIYWFHGEEHTYNLDRTKFGKTELFFHLTYRQDISIEQTTALPSDWLDNTTQTIGSQPTITTAVTTYNPAVVSEALVVPQKISVGMRFIGGIMQQLFELKYITFLSCFIIICALVAWLLH